MKKPKPETTDGKQTGQQWRKGQSGNPNGRPRGARHRALVALDAIGERGAQAVLRSVVGAARQGDLRAAEILLRRIWPERRGRPVLLDLPPIRSGTDLMLAMQAVVKALAAGDLTPAEANDLAAVLDAQRRVIETADIEARVAALEATLSEET